MDSPANSQTATQRTGMSGNYGLSDLNVLELLRKLQSLNLVDLITTGQGTHITKTQLSCEIKKELLSRGGRVNLIDLSKALNVDLSIIQSNIQQAVKPGDSVRLVRGELVTDYYISSLVREVDDALSASQEGLVSIGDIATRYALPVDIVKESIVLHQSNLDAKFDQSKGTLQAKSSIVRNKAAVRGALQGVIAPTLLTEIALTRKLDVSFIREVADELLGSGELYGIVQGGAKRATFIPDVFRDAAALSITSAYSSNGVVLSEQLQHLHFTDVASFAEEHFDGAIVLKSCIVSPVLIETISTSAGEALNNGTWVDIAASLPPVVPRPDLPDVVDRIVKSLPSTDKTERRKVGREKTSKTRRKSATKKNTEGSRTSIIYGGHFVVSHQLVDLISDLVSADAEKKANERAEQMENNVVVIGGNPDTLPTVEVQKTKGKGRRRAGKQKATENSSSANGGTVSSVPIIVPSSSAVLEMLLENDQCSKAFEPEYRASSGDGEELLEMLIGEIYGQEGLQTLYETKATAAVATLERERAAGKQHEERGFLESLEKAQLYQKAAHNLPNEDLIEQSQVWVMDSICVNILCTMLNTVTQNMGISHPGLKEAHQLSTKKEKLEVLRSACTRLPPTLETRMRPFISIVSDKGNGSVDDFLEMYDDKAAIFDLPVRRPLDKKGQKAASQHTRGQMILELEENKSITEQTALRYATILTFAKANNGTIISIPRESELSFCCSIADSATPTEVGAALHELRHAFESRKEKDGNEPLEGLSTPFAETLSALREHIG